MPAIQTVSDAEEYLTKEIEAKVAAYNPKDKMTFKLTQESNYTGFSIQVVKDIIAKILRKKKIKYRSKEEIRGMPPGATLVLEITLKQIVVQKG